MKVNGLIWRSGCAKGNWLHWRTLIGVPVHREHCDAPESTTFEPGRGCRERPCQLCPVPSGPQPTTIRIKPRSAGKPVRPFERVRPSSHCPFEPLPFEVAFRQPLALSCRGVAQLVAHLLWEQEAGGSSPPSPTLRCPLRHGPGQRSGGGSSYFRACGTNFVEQEAFLPPEATTTLTMTVNPGVALEIKYGTVALPLTFATALLSVFVVLYLAVVVTPARATVETRTLVVECCFGLALLMEARHVSGAAKASGATALTEPKLRLNTVTKATRKPDLDLLGAWRSRNCESITTDRSPILARAKDHDDGLSCP